MNGIIYEVKDLFYTSWKDLDDRTHARVYASYLKTLGTSPGSIEYGFSLISTLRMLRRNWRLVDKINELQAVDIFNDLKFLKEPWFNFPSLNHALLAVKPDDMMARSSFDQFIYADNEFSGFLVAKDDIHLRRLAVTLYRPKGETTFDKENVEERQALITGVDQDLLSLVFYTYANVREAVMKRCKLLLPKAPKSSEEIEQKPQRTGAMWHNIKHQAAKTLVFGDFEKVGRTNMYDVLDHLEILCKEREEQRRAKR